MNHILVLLCFLPIFLVLQTGQANETDKSKTHVSTDQILMFSGYSLLGVAAILGTALWLCRNRKKKNPQTLAVNKKIAAVEESDDFTIDLSSVSKTAETSESFAAPSSRPLVVLTGPAEKGLRFEDLLEAPAELLGRGKHGSAYKVMFEEPRMILTVKRIKGWEISSHDFKTRMRRLDQVKHPNVLPPIAFYSSSREKLLVFEYQNNGSLLRRLQGVQTGQAFEWMSRLATASTIAESLAFMHHHLKHDRIPHGNLQSSNVLMKPNMEPCISEYGLKPVAQETFEQDVYGLGVILLELLTGKPARNDEIDLADWVVSVLREEWTGEVFDRSLTREGASEERMVNLLQVAVKCVDGTPEARPGVKQVATMINSIMGEEERSMDVSVVSVSSSQLPVSREFYQ